MQPFCLRQARQQRFYNQAMRLALLLTLSLSSISPCWAQAPAAAPAPASDNKTPTASTTSPVEKRVDRIHVEDAGAKIDELRIGGETKTIEVQPKGRMPAYQIAPASGERSWKILGF